MTPSSMKRDSVVAIAAPRTPSVGKPHLPKISSQLKVRLNAMATAPASIGTKVSPVSRSVPAYA